MNTKPPEPTQKVKRPFLKIEDNGDGTCTVTAYLSEFLGEESYVLMMDFMESLTGFATKPRIVEVAQEYAEKIVEIPKEAPDA